MANKIMIENATIRFRNFRGLGGTYNEEGNRNFCVDLDPVLADQMIADGWNVKFLKPRNPGDEPKAYLKVNVSYNYTPPKVVLISSEGRTNLDETTIGTLDWADIESIDLVITPSYYDFKGRKGIKPYLKSMFVTVEEDELEKKYADRDMIDFTPSHFE